MNRWKIGIVALSLGAYSMVYASDVKVGRLIVVANDDAVRPDGSYDMKSTWFSEGYKVGGNIAYIAFAPANLVDRKLRPEIWGRYDP
jgi:hypothetical protein